jgi:hypothetical protein
MLTPYKEEFEDMLRIKENTTEMFSCISEFFELRFITKYRLPPLLIPLLVGNQFFQAYVTDVHLAQAAHRMHH